MNAKKHILNSLLALMVSALSLTIVSCDDDDDYYPGPGDGYEIFSQSIDVAPLGRPVISPGEPDFRDMLGAYDNVVTLFNSRAQVYDYFTPQELQMYPAITRVDYSRYTVLVYTVYETAYITGFNWVFQWMGDGWSNYPLLDIYFYYTGQMLPPGGLCLGQAALIIDKMWDTSSLRINYHMLPY